MRKIKVDVACRYGIIGSVVIEVREDETQAEIAKKAIAVAGDIIQITWVEDNA